MSDKTICPLHAVSNSLRFSARPAAIKQHLRTMRGVAKTSRHLSAASRRRLRARIASALDAIDALNKAAADSPVGAAAAAETSARLTAALQRHARIALADSTNEFEWCVGGAVLQAHGYHLRQALIHELSVTPRDGGAAILVVPATPVAEEVRRLEPLPSPVPLPL